jgi:hypothetical protein
MFEFADLRDQFKSVGGKITKTEGVNIVGKMVLAKDQSGEVVKYGVVEGSLNDENTELTAFCHEEEHRFVSLVDVS